MVERCLHTAEVGGSRPSSPTQKSRSEGVAPSRSRERFSLRPAGVSETARAFPSEHADWAHIATSTSLNAAVLVGVAGARRSGKARQSPRSLVIEHPCAMRRRASPAGRRRSDTRYRLACTPPHERCRPAPGRESRRVVRFARWPVTAAKRCRPQATSTKTCSTSPGVALDRQQCQHRLHRGVAPGPRVAPCLCTMGSRSCESGILGIISGDC